MSTYVKDPNAILDYTIDWFNWLNGDAIISSLWLAEEGITILGASNTDTTATVWLSGGTAGKTYRVTNRISTSGGRTDDRSLRIMVQDR